MGSGADGAEMCHGRASNEESPRQRKFVLLDILRGSSPRRRPLSSVFAPLITGALCLHPLASSLPVSNSDQGEELVEEAEDGTHRTATHGCVRAARRRLAQPQRSRRRPRDCSGLFQLF